MQSWKKYQDFYAIIARIPSGKVATYGQVASLAGYPGQARQVGTALKRIPDDLDLPWQRVINAKGKISSRSHSFFETIQKQILESEGISFDSQDCVDLEIFQWRPEK